MRIKSPSQLKTMLNGGSISKNSAKQLAHELEADKKRQRRNVVQGSGGISRFCLSPVKPAQSNGEATLGLALRSRFRHWHEGGELVEELVIFPEATQIRVDFALPRWQVYIEVEGWSHHGKSLEDHHADRDRLNFLASRNWHRFAVTHGQATKSAMALVGLVEMCLALREEIPRSTVDITCRDLPSGMHWHEMRRKS